MKHVLTVFCVVSLMSPAAFAQVVEVHFYHTNHAGATASEFRLVSANYSAVYLGGTWNVPAVFGDPLNGIAFGYGTCLTAPVHLGYANFLITGLTCSDFDVVGSPYSLSGQIEVVDCSGTMTYPTDSDFLLDYDPCRVNAPTGTWPPDGAVGVPLNPTLVWNWEGNDMCPEGIGMTTFRVYLGTSPDDLDFVGSPFPGSEGTFELEVGTLPPATTQYWNVKVRDEFWQCPGLKEQLSPVYSFTTEGTIPVEPTTWGRIKSLYR